MDKVILTKDQLNELRQYIFKRGFKDPIVIVEILDHFACKVEEKLTVHNDWDLHRAMEEAHGDFGAMGFKTIVDNLTNQVNHKYKTIYKTYFKKILTDVKSIFILVVVGLFIYYGYIWSYKQGWVYWENHTYFGAFLILVYFLVELYLGFKVIPKDKRTTLFYGAAMQQGWRNAAFFLIIPFQGVGVSIEHYSLLKLKVIAFLVAVISLYFIVQSLARLKAIMIAQNDTQSIEETYQSILD